MTSNHHLDTRGLKCPLPVLKIAKRLKSMKAGEQLSIDATDPAAQIDVPHFCAQAGHVLLVSGELDGVYQFTIRRGEG
ncbi:MAG: sulfurtransferase TusA family protein [Hyphomicrobiales bacterium]